MQRDLTELKNQIKEVDPETLSAHGIIQPARNGGYVCPYCENGTGSDGTGIKPAELSNGYEYHCFKCDKSFDNIDLTANFFNLNPRNDFKEIIERGADLFHISDGSFIPKPKPKKIFIESDKKDFSFFLTQVAKNIENLPESARRGLTLETLKHFKCGYAPQWLHRKVKTPRIIIPSSNFSYMARLIGDIESYSEDEQKNIKEKDRPVGAKKELFNFSAVQNTNDAIFIVEGEIDCMSIWQASKFPCVALGGASVKKYLPELQKISSKKFIVMLDNDDTGKAKSKDAVYQLFKIGHKATAVTLSDQYKDANEFLQADPDGLSKRLTEIYQFVQDNPSDEPFEEKTFSSRQTTKQIISSCPIDLEVPADFVFTKNGILGQKGYICLNPIVITKDFIERIGNTDFHKYELAHLENGKWIREIVDPTTFASSRKITDLVQYGIKVVPTNAKFLANFLVTMSNDEKIPRVRTYSQTGWIDEDCENFIYPPDGNLNGENWQFKPSADFEFVKAFTQKGDRDKFKSLLERALNSSVYSRAVIFSAIAAPALKIVSSRNFTTHLWGRSGGGKTAIIKLATAIFGNPNILMSTFNGTQNAIGEKAALLNDFPFAVDEFQLSDKITKQDMNKFIYGIEKGETKLRLNKNSDQKPIKHFRTVAITTGEQPITKSHSEQGALARVISISANKIIPDDKLSREIHLQSVKNYGFFGREWIEYLCRADVQKNFVDEYEEIYSELDEIKSIVEHSPLPAHKQFVLLIFLAGKYFCKHFGLLQDVDLEENIANDIEKLLLEMPSSSEITDTQRALNMLEDFVSSHDKAFSEEYSDYETGIYKETGYAAPVRFGVIRKKYVAFYRTELEKILNDAGFSADKIIKEFADEGIILRGDSQNLAKLVKVNGKPQRMICLTL